MKYFLSIFLMLSCMLGQAQYNNEWIDFAKTYYKFSVAKDGVCRINQPALQSMGLGITPAEQFQLWRNGIQVPIYTSATTGQLGGAGYIEFWGEMNDGKPDKRLYPDINYQLSDKWSLETDTASYFLTVNPAGNNLRLVANQNKVDENVLPADTYFMYTLGKYYKNKINPGYAGLVGEYVYSSVYDKGEGYTCDDIYPYAPLSETLNNLYPYAGGPDGIFYIAGSGNANNIRTLRARVNNTQLVDAQMDAFNDTRQQVALPASLLSSGSATVQIVNTSANNNDRMVIAKYEITYARQFNFGGASNFVFELVANSSGNFLTISNFNAGAAVPVLYDLTNFKRYDGNTADAGIVKFALPPSLQKRRLVLVNEEAANITTINTFTVKNFINYAVSANQGDYLIISNPILYTGSNGNQVEAYRQYRASATGGGYNAKIYDIDQLTDQFAFGIKRHPFAIKNFLRYVEDIFPVKPSSVFLIGKGVTYVQARTNETNPLLPRLDLVPPFGNPASDNLLASRDNQTVSYIPVGRLSVVTGNEIEIYLNKVKEYESIALNAPHTIAGRGWMKNVVHAIGGGEATLSAQIGGYMNQMRNVIQDTLFGGNVKSFSKTSAVASQLTSDGLKNLFAEGIGMLNYFGHSSASTIEFNIDDPNIYQNQSKYPVFLVNGCLAGDIFNFDANRFNTISTLSEKYVLANQRGAISFVASSHFGIVNYLNTYLKGLYQALSREKYGHSMGEALEESFKYLLDNWTGDYFARLHAEEITLHGDPAIKLYAQNRPDYVIEDQEVVLPPVISVTDNNFKVRVRFVNIGKAESDSFFVTIKRMLADGSSTTLIHKKIKGIAFSDSLELTIPINPALEKGENKLIFTVDSENQIEEMSESNNTITKTFYIVDDGARPVFPYNYSIVNSSNITLVASTANPLALSRTYLLEIDTTEMFNSSLKKSLSTNAVGGIIEFNPSISFINNTVYYWRTAVQTSDALLWNNSSFVYLNGGKSGYNQSHYFQFQKDTYSDMAIEGDRKFRFDGIPKTIGIATGLYPYYFDDLIHVTLDDRILDNYGCVYSSLQFVVYDSITLEPWPNSAQPDGFGRFGSAKPCGHNKNAFEFQYSDTSYRRKAMDFIASIPKGSYVSITNLGTNFNASFINDWMSDTLRFGSGKSLYHSLKNLGLTDIDLFTKNLPFIFFFRKEDISSVQSFVGAAEDVRINRSFSVLSRKDKGSISSVWFGPAKKWDDFKWDGQGLEPDADNISIDIFGTKDLSNESLLGTVKFAHDTSLSFINATQYPYLKLKINNADTLHGTPYQLGYWRLEGQLPPEGALAPNLFYLGGKDTLDIGETFAFGIAFKNISPYGFDSLKVKLMLLDRNNVQHEIKVSRMKPLISGDTLKIQYQIDTKDYPGLNTLFVSFNPDSDQPEQYFMNNFLYKTFFVRPDTFNPLMDVTFDGVHILNDDIVSAKPHIVAKLKDDNRFMVLDDTALVRIQVRYPSGVYRTFSFNNDTLRFTPSVSSTGAGDNTATIDFNPAFLEDGDYELLVSGRDKSGNNAGQSQYRVMFKVINKPMISNLFNYPNPFTSSTAFVFTLTGSEIPQNIRIQILTITGKIVREITKEELGPIRIGRNITEFKWDGSDQYGQKLANGVYLYRVITNMNGKALEKYKTEGDNTDQYFNKGYGKMYLMR